MSSHIQLMYLCNLDNLGENLLAIAIIWTNYFIYRLTVDKLVRKMYKFYKQISPQLCDIHV